MNRSARELMAGGRNTVDGIQHRRGRSLATMTKDTDENLDLFSKNRRSLSVVNTDESEVSLKLGKLSVGSAKLVKSGLDDLMAATDGGKHDYDWLLTPPGTPVFPTTDGNEPHQILGASRSRSLARNVSTTKASRLSVTQSESNHSSRPTRSTSVTRPAVSTAQYSTYSSNKSLSILNTSSASVTSYIRPSSPITRSPSTARPSTPSTRTTPPRSTTPSRTRPTPTITSIDKSRPSPTSTSIDKSRPSQASRPSTPTSRSQILSNFSSSAARPNSRPSTPTRRVPTPSSSPASGGSVSAGRISSNGHIHAPVSRPSSPGPRVRPPSQQVVHPEYLLDAPPNLRTTLPDRPISAGRSRPGLSVTAKGNIDPPSSGHLPKRQPSPIITRARLTEHSGRSHGHAVDMPESRKIPSSSELAPRKSVKSSTAGSDSTGFGRNISKKSLDMAIRHMDIRNGTGGIRPHSGATLFPQSIRSSAPKNQSVRASSTPPSVKTKKSLLTYNNGATSDNEKSSTKSSENGFVEKNDRLSAKLNEIDIYESSRYDAIMLKEDSKNTNWLHCLDDKADQGIIFDNGFESLPEPFSPL